MVSDSTNNWHQRREIADLRGELSALRHALGANTSDDATSIVRALVARVKQQQQQISTLQSQVTALTAWAATVNPPLQ